MKIIRRLFGILLALLIALVIVLFFFSGPIIKRGLEKFSPRVIGTSLTAQNIDIDFLSQTANIEGLALANPEGFKTSNAIFFNQIKVKIDAGTIFSDPIVVEDILISGVRVNYEKTLKGSNLKTIQNNIQQLSSSKSSQEKPAPEIDAKETKQRNLVIKHLLFQAGQISLSAKMLPSQKITLKLPKIERNNLGQDTGGNLKEVTREVATLVLENVMKSVSSSGKLSELPAKGLKTVSDSAKTAEDTIRGTTSNAKKAVDDARKEAGKFIKSVGGLFEKSE